MQITLESKPFAGIESEALVSYVFEESDPVQGRVAEIDKLAGGLLGRLAKSGELTGKTLEFTLIHAPRDELHRRIHEPGPDDAEAITSQNVGRLMIADEDPAEANK